MEKITALSLKVSSISGARMIFGELASMNIFLLFWWQGFHFFLISIQSNLDLLSQGSFLIMSFTLGANCPSLLP